MTLQILVQHHHFLFQILLKPLATVLSSTTRVEWNEFLLKVFANHPTNNVQPFTFQGKIVLFSSYFQFICAAVFSALIIIVTHKPSFTSFFQLLFFNRYVSIVILFYHQFDFFYHFVQGVHQKFLSNKRESFLYSHFSI